MEHICTSESLTVGGIELEASECRFCGQVAKSTVGYVGVRCHHCNNIFSGEEFMGDIVKIRRLRLGYNRLQFAKLLGISKHTIKAYEYKKCSEWYYVKTLELVRELK